MKRIINKEKNSRTIIFVIIFIVGIVGIMTYSSVNTLNKPTKNIFPPVTYYPNNSIEGPVPIEKSKQTTSTWSTISQVNQSRMREIMIGVMQNTIVINPEIKQEFWSIIRKYNTTDEEIGDFGMYGPGIAVNYQKMFFTDALQAVRSGITTKSQERSDYENELLSKGLMTAKRIQQNDAEMYVIANHQVVGSSGKVLTIDDINQTLNNINAIGTRLQKLFSRPVNTSVSNTESVNISLEKNEKKQKDSTKIDNSLSDNFDKIIKKIKNAPNSTITSSFNTDIGNNKFYYSVVPDSLVKESKDALVFEVESDVYLDENGQEYPNGPEHTRIMMRDTDFDGIPNYYWNNDFGTDLNEKLVSKDLKNLNDILLLWGYGLNYFNDNLLDN